MSSCLLNSDVLQLWAPCLPGLVPKSHGLYAQLSSYSHVYSFTRQERWINKRKSKIIPSTITFDVVVQSLSCVQLFAAPWTTGRQVSPSFTISGSLCKLMSDESMMPSNHFIGHPLFLLSSVFPSIRVFSSESALCIRWPKYWSFSFSIRPSSEYSELISFRIDWFDHLSTMFITLLCLTF